MAHPVAPGKDGYNLLSKRDVFRVVLLQAMLPEDDPGRQEALVLEAEDGSYKCALPFAEAMKDGHHIVFDFVVRDRHKKYRCYFEGEDDKLEFDTLCVPMTGLLEQESQG